MAKFVFKKNVVTLNGFINASGQVFSSAYISICLVTVTVFHCFLSPNLRKSLVVYPSVFCWEGGTHGVMLGYSVCALAIYVLGLFTTVAYVIWKFPKMIMKDSLNFIRRFNFLFCNWTPQCYWFSMLVLIRNLLVALLPKLISPEFNKVTLVLILIVLMTHICFLLYFRPWRTPKLNFLDIMLSVALQVVLTGGIMLNFEPTIGTIISYSIFSLCIASFLCCCGFIAWKVMNLYALPARYAFFISHHKVSGACTARLLKTLLSKQLEQDIFYDSDNLNDLSGIVNAVKITECLLVLLTGETLCRPWCAAEIITAAQLGIVLVPCTLGISAEFESDSKDRYQTLNSAGLEQLFETFDILRPHGIPVEEAKTAFDVLLSLECLHLNLSEASDVMDKIELLANIAHLTSGSKSICRWFVSERSARTSQQKLVSQALQSRKQRTVARSSMQNWGRHLSQRVSQGMSVLHTGSSIVPTFSGGNGGEKSQAHKWMIISDNTDFEAISAARYIKTILQVSLQTEITLDVKMSTIVIEDDIDSFSVFLFLLTIGTLSSATQLARLTLLTSIKPAVNVKPVLITDAFRFPDESYYRSLETNGGLFGESASEIFSHRAGLDISCKDVVKALRSVFQNISTFVHVPVASEKLLHASISQMIERVQLGQKQTESRTKTVKDAWAHVATETPEVYGGDCLG